MTMSMIFVEAIWSKNSCGFVRIVFQESPEPFTTLQRALTYCVLADCRKEQEIPLALMIPLVMIMLYVLLERMPEGGFPKQNQPRQGVVLHRAHPPLRIRIEI